MEDCNVNTFLVPFLALKASTSVGTATVLLEESMPFEDAT